MSTLETINNGQISVGFSTLGGTITSLKDADGLEYLWQGDAEYWTGQSPVLFPICGSIRDDKAVLKNGKTTAMPRHGIIRKDEFVLEEKTENSITFSIESNEKTLEKFPFNYKVYVKHEVEEKSLKVTHIVENTGDEDMPFFVGAHPGFNCPLEDGEKYTDYYIEFEKNETCSVPELDTERGLINITKRSPFFNNENKLQLDSSLFHKDAILFDELASRSVKYVSSKSGKGLQIDFPDMPYLVLWDTANDGPFVAIEPWVGLSTCDDESDVFEEKRNLQIAKPGEKKSYSYTIRIL